MARQVHNSRAGCEGLGRRLWSQRCKLDAGTDVHWGRKLPSRDSGGYSPWHRSCVINLLLWITFVVPGLCQDQLNVTIGINEGGSSLAVFFSDTIATPFKAAAPRLFTAQTMRMEMQVTGFFDPSDMDYTSRQDFRASVANAINSILTAEQQPCCLFPENVTVTNVCDSTGKNCLNYMLLSLPEDCGNAIKLDPEECDDGNLVNGDGCSSSCSVEEGFVCLGGNRFTYDVCASKAPPDSAVAARRGDGGHLASGAASYRGRMPAVEAVDMYHGVGAAETHRGGANRKLLASSVRVGVRIGRGMLPGGGPLMVEKYIWASQDSRFLLGVQEKMSALGYSILVRFTGTGQPSRDLYSGSPRTFVYGLFNGEDLGACFVKPFRGVDGTACSYVDTIMGTSLLGIFLMGVTVVVQCGLCCARFFPCLTWIGICWGEPACGGALPTKRRKPQVVFRCEVMLFLAWGLVLACATLGWRTTVQLNFDFEKAIEALDVAQGLSTVFRNKTQYGFRELKVEAKERMEIINRRLSSLRNLTRQTVQANASMNLLLQQLDDVRSFIEGRRIESDDENQCTFYDQPTGLPLTFDTLLLIWRLPDGNASVSLKPPGKHEFGVGRGQLLTNNRTAPTCTNHKFVVTDYTPMDMECPCCRECVIYSSAVKEGIVVMPTPDKFEKFNQRLPTEYLEGDIDALEAKMETGTAVVDRRMANVQASMQLFRTIILEIRGSMDAVQFLLWGLTVMGSSLIIYGLMRSSYRCLIYGYIIGAIGCVVILFPFFTFGSLVVLPFGDGCAGIPKTGGDPSSFLSTFSKSGSLRDVNISTIRMVQDCLTTSEGNVWNVAGMDRRVVFDALSRYDISDKVTAADVAAGLNTEENDLTLSFSNHKDAMQRMTADNKIFGYDSQPTAVDSSGYTTFLNGGVIDGSRYEALVHIVNVALVSTYNEKDLITECQRLASNPITGGCLSNQTAQYNEECCPETRFETPESREPAQKVWDYTLYRQMLQKRITQMQNTLLDADKQITLIKRDSLILERNISYMRIEAANEVNRITEKLIKIGSCAPFNSMYEALRIPFCQNLNRSMDSVWMMCFILGCSWFPLFALVLRNIKIIMLSKGFGKPGSQADAKQIKAAIELKKLKQLDSALTEV